MKRLKKILALAIAMAMVVAMALPAMAASIEVTDSATSNHVYKVYQIFTGTLTEKTDATTGEKTQTLSDVKYGSNYTGLAGDKTTSDSADAEAKAIETNNTTAREFATNLKDGITTNGEISGAAVATLNKDNNFKATGLADGYYLIVDETGVTNLEDGDMLSRYIVQVIGDTALAPKKSTVEEHKEIKSDTHTPSDVTTDKTADDLSVGETVTYSIDATVPENAVDFDKFFFVINDTLSPGLTLNTTSFSVYYMNGSTKVTLTENANDGYTLFVNDPESVTENRHAAPDRGKTFQIALKNPKALAGKTIFVEYTATLNENAVIGETPNTNKTTVQYSNNPEQDYDGEDTNNDGKPDDLTKNIYGETPEQETKTFTSSIRLKKTDGTNTLQGAKFKITGDSVKTVLVTSDVFEEGTGTGYDYYKLKDGTYTTVAPAENDSYVLKGNAPGATTYNVDDGGYVRSGEGPDYTYTVATYDQLRDSTTPIYAKVTATKDQYEAPVSGVYKKYKKTTKTETIETSQSVSAEAFVDSNGFVKFDGLGAGTYTITETQTPTGYNSIEPFTVTISFDKTDADKDTTNNDTDADNLVWSATSPYVVTQTNTTGTITEVDSNSDSVVDTFLIEVINQSGTQLPSTGGIGTTIFYVVGAILVIGAGVVLITRRRMDA